MPNTQVNCPNCRQPVVADIQQLFDVGEDPSAKQLLLSGMSNILQCPHCGFQGNIAAPIVYHDPEKELLLTYFPPEMGKTRDEQERILGSLITQAVNRLPQEQRKGYLFKPQSTLTMQGLVERILEEDGITKEMIEAQQKKLSLIQRLLSASEERRVEIAQQEDELIDEEFYALLNRLYEASALSGDRESAQQLATLQQDIMPVTTHGRELQKQTEEVEAAINSLRELGENLTRETLLDLVIKAPSEIRVRTLVSLTRPAMDYEFFQLLSQHIDRARGDGRTRLIKLRDDLLEMTREVDQQMQERQALSVKLLNSLLQSPDIEEATRQNLPIIDDFFMQELDRALNQAREQGDLEQIGKLQKIVNVVEEANEPPPEVEFIEELVDAPDEATRRQIIESNRDKLTPEFLSLFTNILAQVESSGETQLAERMSDTYDQVLRFSMQANLNS